MHGCSFWPQVGWGKATRFAFAPSHLLHFCLGYSFRQRRPPPCIARIPIATAAVSGRWSHYETSVYPLATQRTICSSLPSKTIGGRQPPLPAKHRRSHSSHFPDRQRARRQRASQCRSCAVIRVSQQGWISAAVDISDMESPAIHRTALCVLRDGRTSRSSPTSPLLSAQRPLSRRTVCLSTALLWPGFPRLTRSRSACCAPSAGPYASTADLKQSIADLEVPRLRPTARAIVMTPGLDLC